MVRPSSPRSSLVVAALSASGLVVLGLVAGACGAPPPVKTQPTATAEAEPEQPIEVRKSSLECSDGTCFRCGEGMCLAGQYCNTTTQTCGWLSECATKATCECVTRVLGSCGCEERDGGAFVSCN